MPLKGARQHLNRLRRLASGDVARVMGSVVYEGADIIRVEAFHSISAGSVSGKGHVASAPGEPPNRDTGDLQGGLKSLRTGPLTAEVRAEAPHSAPLEFGTSRMAARPFMRPARDKKIDEVRKRMADQIDALVKRSG